MTSPYDQYAVEISGVGNADGQYLLCTVQPPSDTSGLWLSYLVDFPIETAENFALRDGSSAGGDMDFVLDSASNPEAVGGLIGRYGRPTITARMSAEASPTSTIIRLDASGLAGRILHGGLEAVLLGNETLTGVYTGCTRGHLNTPQTRLRDQLPLSLSPQTLAGRLVTLYEYSPYQPNTREVRWRGITYSRSRDIEGRKGLRAVSLAKALERVTALRSTFEARIVSGSWATGIQLESDALPIAGPVDDRRVVLQTEGGATVVATWTPTGDGEGCLLTIPAGAALLASPESGALEGPPVGEVFTERLFVGLEGGPQWRGYNGTGWTPPTNPSELIRAALVSTSGGQNGAHDAGVEGWGCGIPEDLLDASAWNAAAVWCSDRSLARFDVAGVGEESADVRGTDLIQRVFSHLPLVVVHRFGLLTLTTRHTLPLRTKTARIDQAATGGELPSGWDYSDTAALSEVTVLREALGTRKTSVQVQPDYADDLTPFAPTSSLDARADGLDSLEAQLSSLAWSERSAYPPPVVSWGEVDREYADLGAGDVVEVTHPWVPSPDGGEGVEGATGQVISASLRLGREGETTATTALKIALHGDGRRFGRIAPTARITSATSLGGGAISVVCEHHHFVSDGVVAAPVNNDTEGFAIGDVVTLTDRRLEQLAGFVDLAVISVSRGVGEDAFVLTGASGTPSNGNLMRMAALTSQAHDGLDWCWASSTAPCHWTDEAPVALGEVQPGVTWQTLTPSGACADECPVDQALCVTLARNVESIQGHTLRKASATPAVWRDLRLHGRPHPLSLPLPLDFTGVRKGEITLHCDGVDANVLVRPVLVESDGRVTPLAAYTTVEPGTDRVVSWTINPPRDGAQDVRLEAVSARASSASHTFTDEIDSLASRRVNLDASGAPHAPLDEDSIYLGEFSLSSAAPSAQVPPSDRLILTRTWNLIDEDLFVWPVFSDDDLLSFSVAVTQGWLEMRLYKIGWLRVHHLTWSETERYTPTCVPDVMRTGLDPSAPRLRRVGAVGHQALLRGRLLSIGPSCGPVESANNISVHAPSEYGDTARSPWGRLARHPATSVSAAETLWSTHISHTHTAEDVSGDIYRQRETRVTAGISAYHRAVNGPQSQVVRLQLVAEDADDPSTNPQALSDVIEVELPVVTNTSTSDYELNRAWLQIFTRSNNSPADDIWLSDHSARGLLTLHPDISLVTLTVADVDDASLTSQRRLRLVLLPPLESAGAVGGDVVRVKCVGAYADSFGLMTED